MRPYGRRAGPRSRLQGMMGVMQRSPAVLQRGGAPLQCARLGTGSWKCACALRLWRRVRAWDSARKLKPPAVRRWMQRCGAGPACWRLGRRRAPLPCAQSLVFLRVRTEWRSFRRMRRHSFSLCVPAPQPPGRSCRLISRSARQRQARSGGRRAHGCRHVASWGWACPRGRPPGRLTRRADASGGCLAAY